ncbi:sigma-54 interaction domain-containing protein [Brevibacillus sp. GCM10020057]|uniref:sigma-54 interaction domain-containing protein n=1 Tax=Brevibacillus sp. GCM10020057 TaxID=3317327 RepID=UPI003638D181
MGKKKDDYQALQEKLRELEVIFEASHDEIFVADAQGNTIRVNPACERHYGLQGIELVGRNVYDLEREGLFYPSATIAVLENKRPVTLVQSTSTGRRLIVTANPVFDESGNLSRVVSTSVDITEIILLKRQIEEMEKAIAEYDEKLKYFRSMTYDKQGPLIAKSKAMVNALELLERVANVDTIVLFLGESGAGKSEIARWLHDIGRRKDGPFVEVNCSAIPPQLFESELFGYERGSFSGALSTGKIGLIESAQKGTLFLDEIGELPLELQTKLLQVIQKKTVMRIGGRTAKQVDVRFLAATNQDLEQMVKKGTFRQDLYYRLNVIPVKVPPLRERPEDLVEMIFVFLERTNKKYGTNKMFSSRAIDQLLSYHWPGNIRELENVIERLVITASDSVIHLEDLSGVLEISAAAEGQAHSKANAIDYLDMLVKNQELGLKEMVEIFERDIIQQLMQSYGSTRKVAKRLATSQSSISRKYQQRLNVSRKNFPKNKEQEGSIQQ